MKRLAALASLAFTACAAPPAPTCASDDDCTRAKRCVAHACVVDTRNVDELAAVPVSITTSEDVVATAELAFLGGDPTVPVEFVLFGAPQLGLASIDRGVLTYVPHADVAGADAMQVAPVQSGAIGRPARVDVTVTAVDDGPRLTVIGPILGDTNVTATFAASATDRENQAVTFTATFSAGTAEVMQSEDDIATVTYNAPPGYRGKDGGTIVATDDGGATTTQPVAIDVP